MEATPKSGFSSETDLGALSAELDLLVLVCQPEGLGSSPQLCPGDLVKMMVS